MADWSLHLGDCRAELPRLEGGSVDCVVTDPPYNLAQIGRSLQLPRSGPGQDYDRTEQRNGRERGFMGCEWDNAIAFRPEVWAECLRVAKAGAYLLAFGGTRTHHRMMCAVEDAGWELTDVICWLHSQGFPKGKGCLKPAWEPIVLARKPAPRVAPLGIDECRIPGVVPATTQGASDRVYGNGNGFAPGGLQASNPSPAGRWPANVLLEHHEACVCQGTRRVKAANWCDEDNRRGRGDGVAYNGSRDGSFKQSTSAHYAGPDGQEEVEDWSCVEECPVRMLDEQAGERTSGAKSPHHRRATAKGWSGPFSDDNGGPAFRSFTGGDTGSASRFFFTAKASRADRGEGNDHNTVKPTALMQWLVKLVARPGETVLDPFTGSASTGVACLRSGRRFIGIERDPHYFEIAQRRLAAVDGPLFANAPAVEEGPA